jgi:hypothetical protein
MSAKVFRNTSYVLTAFVLISALAVSDAVDDGASWGEKFVLFSSAAAPWLISGVIVWTASEVLDAVGSNRGDAATGTDRSVDE